MSDSGKRHAKYLDGKQKLYWDFVEVDKYIYIYIYPILHYRINSGNPLTRLWQWIYWKKSSQRIYDLTFFVDYWFFYWWIG